MGLGFRLDWKWAIPIRTSPLSSSSSRLHSASRAGATLIYAATCSNLLSHMQHSRFLSVRGREALREPAKVYTLSVTPEESESQYKDPLKPHTCTFGAPQSNENIYAAIGETKIRISNREDSAASNYAKVPIVNDASACLASLRAGSTSQFVLLMENLEKIEAIFEDSDMVRLERDILVHIERLGALKIFHACLSRTFKAPDAPKQVFPPTDTTKTSLMGRPMDGHMNNMTVRSGKKRERKSWRERATGKAAKTSASSKAIHGIQKLPTKLSSRSRRHAIVRNESEMARGVKAVANLEKTRVSLKEKIGQAASLSEWADAAGMDVKDLQQNLHFGWYCRDNLLKSTRSLVLYLARNYRGRGVGLEDLLQAGNMGVLQGAGRFDPTRGYQFSTYVQYWIRKSMSALVAHHSRGIRIPVALNNAMNKTQKATRAFHNHHGRHPEDEEIAKFINTSLTNVRLANKCFRIVGSLDQKVGDSISIKFREITPDKMEKTPEEIVMRQHMIREIHELLKGLHPQERQVLELRYGFGDSRHKSLEEIGRLFHVSKEWIRRMEKAALTKLRKEEVRSSLKCLLEL